ncbi:MAG: hypothetical protein ACK5O2_15395 [Microthrixaceae bacterium]
MKVAVEHADAERYIVDALAARAADIATPAPTIGIGVPPSWTPTAGMHLRVQVDSTSLARHPAASDSVVRLTAWSASPTAAKRAVNRALGVLSVTPVFGRPLDGFVVARDPSTEAHLASVSLMVTLRSAAI